MADYCIIVFIICDLGMHETDLTSFLSFGNDSADYYSRLTGLVNCLGGISGVGIGLILKLLKCVLVVLLGGPYNNDVVLK